MASVDKFTFGQDFGRVRAAPLTPSADERARQAAQSQARSAGYAEGVAAGRAQAARELDQRLAGAIEAVAARAADILTKLDHIESGAANEAATFALHFAEAAAGVALQRFPLAALEAAARETFAQLRQAPHCVVRLNESLVEQANEMLARAARERGFEGRIVVMGEADISLGDFTLEWADGGVRRAGEALRQRLVEAIERHIATPPQTL